MTIPNGYMLASVTIGTTVLHVMDSGLSENLKQIARALSGDYQTKYAAILERDPKVTGKTTDIAGFLSEVGVTPAAKSVVLGYVKVAADGTRDAAGFTVSLASALVIPRTLSCAQGGEATLSFDCIAISSDGVTSPLTYATAAPGAPTSDASVFTLGGGGTLTGLQNADLDFGLKEKIFKTDGAVYPTRVHIESWEPVLKLKTADLSLATEPAAVTTFLVKFAKVKQQGIRDTGLITITVPSGFKTVTQASGSHPGEAALEVSIAGVKGTGSMLTVVAS